MNILSQGQNDNTLLICVFSGRKVNKISKEENSALVLQNIT